MGDSRSCRPDSVGGLVRLVSGLAFAGLACGCGPDEPQSVEDLEGFWFDLRDDSAWLDLGPEQRRAIEDLEALGYAGGYEPPGERTGVLRHQPESVEPGLNLWSSGHAPEAYLMTTAGEVVHSWRHAYRDLPNARELEHTSQNAWRRVRLLDDGSLLAIHEGLALLKVDRASELVWHFPGGAHHDLDLAPDGRIHVLTRRAHLRPEVNSNEPILEDFITTLSPDGEVLESVSLLACLAESAFSDVLASIAPRGGDLLHTNTLDLLDEVEAAAHPAFEAGHFLVCFREVDALACVDAEQGEVVWMTGGPWVAPHQPVLTSTGSLILFDNMGHEGFSRVLEVDPVEGRELWSYAGSPPAAFFSIFCGAAERLAGGTTLITESCRGRAIEVDREGQIVWEYASPHRAGAEGQFVAALYEMTRIPEAAVSGWLQR